MATAATHDPVAVDTATAARDESEQLPATTSEAAQPPTQEPDITVESSSNGTHAVKTDETGAVDPPADDEPQPTTGPVKRVMDKLGLSPGSILIMFKGSIPPVVAVAMYQATPVALHFGTLGYIIPIVSVISLSILPRAKFLQNLILNLVAICVGAAIAILGLWSAVQARLHTQPAQPTTLYNSSASAVCAIWLIANIYFINVLRGKYPQLQITVIMYSIFTNISFTLGPQITSTAQIESFIKTLLEAFLVAFGLALATNIIIVPISCRDMLAREHTQFIGAVRQTIKAEVGYVRSLESSDMFKAAEPATSSDDEEHHGLGKRFRKKKPEPPQVSPETKALKAAIAALMELDGKIQADTPFAKREIAWGKLDAADYSEINKLFRFLIVPLMGLSTIQDIFQRVAIRRGWIKDPSAGSGAVLEKWEQTNDKTEEKRVWNEVMKALHEPFATLSVAMDEGMEHAGLQLEMLKRPKKKDDVEAKGDTIKPGDAGFADLLEERIKTFRASRGEVLRTWARQRGVTAAAFNTTDLPPVENPDFNDQEARHRRDQQQLYLILFMEYLLNEAGTAVLNLCRFADTKVADGVMAKKRFLFPSRARLFKWIKNVGAEDTAASPESPDFAEGANTVYVGLGFSSMKKDPEHLPPTSGWERFGNAIRYIPRFLGSAESGFGARAVCATMTVGITAFLESTQTFFVQQRLVWAMIIVAIGMTMTAGQSIFGFIGRVVGTALSMVTSLIIWYIVDQKTAGIIVMLWLFIVLDMYFLLRYPRALTLWVITMVTQVLIIGYELQARKIGIQAAEASGQPYYPIYELAPYRLATIAGGTFVSFIWVFLPYPLTDRSWLRKDLANILFLLANYYNATHSTIHARMHGIYGDPDVRSSPGGQLQRIRHKLFGKLMLLLPSLKQHAAFQKFEISIGGKFPRETYEELIQHVSNLSNFISLLSFCSQTWNLDSKNSSQWTSDFIKLVDMVSPTSHQITSVITILSSSIRAGSALPPYVTMPEPFHLSRRLEQLDRNILDLSHIDEPAYSAYAVMQVTSSLIVDDIRKLAANVKDLVGEVDFSFVVADEGSSSSLDKGKQE